MIQRPPSLHCKGPPLSPYNLINKNVLLQLCLQWVLHLIMVTFNYLTYLFNIPISIPNTLSKTKLHNGLNAETFKTCKNP